MAKQVKNSDLVQGKLWDPTIKETESLITVLDRLEKSFKDVSKASSEAAKKADPGSAKGINTINEELEKQKRIKSELSKVDKQREAAEGRLRIAQSKQGQELERTNQRLLRQRQANRALAKETDNLNSAYGRSSARLTRLTKKYKDLEFQNKGNTREAKRLLRQITFLDAKLKATDKTVGQSQRNVGNYSSAFKGLGGGIASAIGPMIGITAAIAGITAGLRAVTGLFREFGLVSAKVQAVSGATAEEFEALQTQAKELGRVTPFTATNVAELQLELSKLGLTASEIGDSTEGIINFGIATDSALGQAGKTVASTINAFELLASDSGKVADVLTEAFSSSALNLEKFDTALGIVGATANLAGLSLEETTAILGTLVDAGVDASKAATGLRKVLAISANENRDYKEVLAEIVGDTNQLSKANELFGLTAQSQAALIAKNIDKVDDLTLSLQNAGGASAEAAAIIGDTLDGDIKRLTSAIQGATLENEGFEKVLRKIIQFLTKAVPPVFNFFVKMIDIVVELFKPLAITLELIGDGLNALGKAFGGANSETASLSKQMTELLGPLDRVLLALRLMTKSAQLFSKEVRELSKKPLQSLINVLFPVTKANKEFNEELDKTGFAARQFGRSLSDNATDQLERYSKAVATAAKLTGFFKGLLTGAADFAEKIFKGLGLDKLAGDTLEFIEKLKKEFIISKITEDIKKQALTVGELEKAISQLNSEIKNTNTNKQASELQGLIKLLEAQKDAILGVGEARKDSRLSDAELEVEKQFQKDRLQLLSETDEKLLKVKEDITISDIERQVESERIQNELAEKMSKAEIKRLQDLIQARGEILKEDDDTQIKLRQELQTKLTDVTINGIKERSDAEIKALEEHNKEIETLEEDHLKAVAALQEKIQDDTIAAIDVLDQAFAKSSDNRINEIDREIQALQDRENALRQAAQNGSEIAKDNLATNQRLQAEQIRVREEQVKKAQRREIALAVIKAYAENAGQPNAVNKTLSDVALLSAAVSNLTPFFHGTDDTGKGGALRDQYGAITGLTHEDEIVLSKEDRGTIGFDKTRADIKDAFAFQEMHQFQQVPIVHVQRFESNAEVLQKFDVLADKLDQLPKNMPRLVSENFDEKSKVYTTIIKTRNKVEKNHKKIGGAWG